MIKLTPIATVYGIIAIIRAVKVLVNTAPKPNTTGGPVIVRMPPPNGVSR